ncbi:hypothetical protein [Pelagibius sp.]|uniref:hypothetical protein n=1 Tax=Pelagibius sp. TaxID=1931238 RepID=UPI003BAF0181
MTGRGKERRRDRRCPVELPALLGELAVMLTDISVVSFGAVARIRKASGPNLSVGDIDSLEVQLTPDRVVHLTVVIERAPDPEGHFGGRFVNLSDENYRLIEATIVGWKNQN